jgi:hypothetical protein
MEVDVKRKINRLAITLEDKQWKILEKAQEETGASFGEIIRRLINAKGEEHTKQGKG